MMLEWKKMVKVWRKCLLFSFGAFFLPSHAACLFTSLYSQFWCLLGLLNEHASLSESKWLCAKRAWTHKAWEKTTFLLSGLVARFSLAQHSLGFCSRLASQTSSLSGWALLSQFASLSEPFSSISKSSLH